MKKTLLFLLSLFFFNNLYGHIGHYNNFKNIEFDIYRNDKLIGTNQYFFTKKDNILKVKNIINVSVELLGVEVFKISGNGLETYENDQLISYSSQTIQNKKQKFVNLTFNKDEKNFHIEGSSYSGKAAADNIVGNWWNHKILQSRSQISPISGSLKNQKVTFLKKTKLKFKGSDYDVNHFKIVSEDKKIDFDVWYNPSKSLIMKVSYSKKGDWEYRLRSFK